MFRDPATDSFNQILNFSSFLKYQSISFVERLGNNVLTLSINMTAIPKYSQKGVYFQDAHRACRREFISSRKSFFLESIFVLNFSNITK